VLLAENLTGYYNLVRLVSLANLESRRTFETFSVSVKPEISIETRNKPIPCIDLGMLSPWAEDGIARSVWTTGLIALSSWRNGHIFDSMVHQGDVASDRIARKFSTLFDEGNFYVEIQNHNLPDDPELIDRMIRLAERLNLPVVATNGVRHLKQAHIDAYRQFANLEVNYQTDRPNQSDAGTDQLYLKSPTEMGTLFDESILSNSVAIANRCEITLRAPSFEYLLPVGSSFTFHISCRLISGLGQKYRHLSLESDESAIHDLWFIEACEISQDHLLEYFMAASNFVRFARTNNIMIEAGGSSPNDYLNGSIVSYMMDITQIDPIPLVLFFKEFLHDPENPFLFTFTIDSEFSDVVVNYFKQQMGSHRVAVVPQFKFMKSPHDYYRYLGGGLSATTRSICSTMLEAPVDTIVPHAGDPPPLMEPLSQEFARFVAHSKILAGIFVGESDSNTSSLVILSDGSIDDWIPLSKTESGAVQTQFDAKGLRKMGFAVFNLVFSKALTRFRKRIKLAEEIYGLSIEPASFPLDDADTFDLIRRGDTEDVDHLMCDRIRDFARISAVSNIEELIIILALFHPDMSLMDKYLERKTCNKTFQYTHPSLEPILRQTSGLILYVEQVIQILLAVTDLSSIEAVTLTRNLRRNKGEAEKETQDLYINACARKGLLAETSALTLFTELTSALPHCRIKAIFINFAIRAYRSAYLKTHFPKAFVLSAQDAQED